MKKSRISTLAFVVTFLALSSIVFPAHAENPTVPNVISFVMSPSSVDITTAATTVSFDLVVSNAAGISSTQTLVTLSDGGNNSVSFPIIRTDSPVNTALQTVEFKGSYNLAANLPSGVYRATAAPIIGLTSAGGPGYSTQPISATSSSTFLGVPNALLVRSAGYLNYNMPTFIGPAFNTFLGNKFLNPKFNSVPAPIWKVGETFNPKDYYELQVPAIALKVKTSTPAVCSSDGTLVTFLAVGNCEFIVYTDKTYDYQYRQDDQVVAVTAARIKPAYVVNPISTQSSANLPLSIQGPFIYGPFGLVVPVSVTPNVCFPVGSYVTIVSGGVCTLNYSTPASAAYLASDIYSMTFQITRTAQSLAFSLPKSTPVSGQPIQLSASASSGGQVTFQSSSADICSVTGNSLTLLRSGVCQVTGLQAGTTTVEPVSSLQTMVVTGSKVAPKVKLVCVKKGKSLNAVGKKCPKGYTLKNAS